MRRRRGRMPNIYPYHYSSDDVARFWGKVAIAGEGDCWEWQGAYGGGGKKDRYGRFKLRPDLTLSAHRVAWEIGNNSRLGSMFACHTCDNTKCVNPRHLYAGDQQSNTNDAKVRGRYIGRGSKVLGSENPRAVR